MTLKQTIDFTVPNPAATANYSLPLFQGCDFNTQYQCWAMNQVNGFFKFNLFLPQAQGINLIFQFCSTIVNGVSNCPISITVNGQLLVSAFDPHIEIFYDMVWSVPASMLQAGNNEIVVTLVGGSTKVFMRYATVDMYLVATDETNWMSTLPDALTLSEINLPGTHDAAAINSTVHTPYACHNVSITNQLAGGIRILDVRLKVTQTNGRYGFMTCHGSIGSSSGINEYQTFPSLLEECKAFLAAHISEAVLMSLKIDDWNGFGGDQTNVLNALNALLSLYPNYTSRNNPTLGDVRSRIVLLNRINDDLRFGTPISWADNTNGSYANPSNNRAYNVYVQDRYTGLPTFSADSTKLNLVTAALTQKQAGQALLNFASATWFGVIGVYIMGDLLAYFGQQAAPRRPTKIGWLMLDYEFEKYSTDAYGSIDLVHFLIASNFNYRGYENQFRILGHDEL